MVVKRMWMSMLILAALAVSALPVRAQEAPPLPESAVTENVALALWVDADQFTPPAVRAAAERLNDALPEGRRANAQQLEQTLNQNLASFEQMHQAFTDAGVEGMLMLAQTPADNNTPAPEPAVLLRTSPETTVEDLQNALDQVEQPENAEPTNFTAYSEGWFIDQEQQPNMPTDGTAEQAQEFQTLFSQTGDAPVRIAFRMTPGLKQQLQQQAGGAGGMGQAIATSAQALNAGWATVSLGDDPNLNPTLRFDDAQGAEQFNTAWNDLLAQLEMQLTQFAQMMGNNGQNQIDAQAVGGLINTLRLEQAGETLTGRVGGEFVTNAGELGPLLQQMAMMMMMGAQGGPGAPPPQRGGPQGPPRN